MHVEAWVPVLGQERERGPGQGRVPGVRPVAVLEVLRAVLRGAQQGQAVRPAVELQEGRQREAERPEGQLVQPAPPRGVVGLQVGPRLPKQDSRQQRG